MERVDWSGDIGEADIGALVFRARLAPTPLGAELHATADAEVGRTTSKAVAAVKNTILSLAEAAVEGRAALTMLSGIDKDKEGRAGRRLCSTLPRPIRLAVYDRRVQGGIERLGLKLSD